MRGERIFNPITSVVELSQVRERAKHRGCKMKNERDHLFISYAWEDGALAEWLTLKLLAAGYLVWCDRFKILGGDRWPERIDEAIKTRTHRMIHLLSSHSLHKENPSAERQLALTIGKTRREPFLIPLNVDNVRDEDVPWQLSEIQYIDFLQWGQGLGKLLKTLEEYHTPRLREKEGKWIASEACLPRHVTTMEAADVVESNCLPFIHIPEVIRRFSFSRSLSKEEQATLAHSYAFYRISDRQVLAFHAPAAQLAPGVIVRDAGGAMWRNVSAIDGIAASNIVSALLWDSLRVRCYEKGLRYDEDSKAFYFPTGLIDKDRIVYQGYKGRKTRIDCVGKRTFPSEVLVHHLAFRLRVKRGITDGYVAQVCLRLQIYTGDGNKIEGKQIGTKRKKITKNWWNHQWLSRQIAIRSFLSDGSTEIIVQGMDHESRVVLSSIPLGGQVRPAIDEKSLASLRLKVVEIQEAEVLDEAPEETEQSESDEREDVNG